MSAESEESTVMQPKVMRIVHPKAFGTLEIRLTEMVDWIIQTRGKMNVRQTTNPTKSIAVALKLGKAQSTEL